MQCFHVVFPVGTSKLIVCHFHLVVACDIFWQHPEICSMVSLMDIHVSANTNEIYKKKIFKKGKKKILISNRFSCFNTCIVIFFILLSLLKFQKLVVAVHCSH